MNYWLYISYPTGTTSVQTFATRFDRALMVLMLSSQPVTLRTVDGV